jgi:hypothetical protein
MEFTRIQKGRGFKYACCGYLYSRSNTKKNIIYLTCDDVDCSGTAKIENALLTVLHAHDSHSLMEADIEKLSLLSRMRKRAAEQTVCSLRQIFDEETRSSTASNDVGFNEVENSMYKRRRVQQPSLPGAAAAVPDAIEGSCYASIGDNPYYRGQVCVGKRKKRVID